MSRPPAIDDERARRARKTLESDRGTVDRMVSDRMVADAGHGPQATAPEGTPHSLEPKKLAKGTFTFEGVKIQAEVKSVSGGDTGKDEPLSPTYIRTSDNKHLASITLHGAFFLVSVDVKILGNPEKAKTLQAGYVQNITDSPLSAIYRIPGDSRETMTDLTYRKLPIVDTKAKVYLPFTEAPAVLLADTAAAYNTFTTSDKPDVRVTFRGVVRLPNSEQRDLGKLTRLKGSRTFVLTFRVRDPASKKQLDLLRVTINTLYDVSFDSSGNIEKREVVVQPVSSAVVKQGDKPPADGPPTTEDQRAELFWHEDKKPVR